MPLPYRRILVALDGSEEASAALTRGIELALAYDSVLAVCHVINHEYLKELHKQSPDVMLEALKQQGSDIVHQGKEQAEKAGLGDVRVFLKEGLPKMMIPEEIAEQFQADLIIAGGSGAGTFERKLFGTVSAGIVRRAPCDVWIIKNSDPTALYRSILIAVDGSETATSAFYAGLNMAKRHHSQAQVSYVLNTPSLSSVEPYSKDIISIYKKRAGELLDRYRTLSEAEKPVLESIQFSVEHGAPKTIIPASAAKKYHVDLIVTGASGISRARRLILGSVSEETVRKAHCDVLVVRNQHRPLP
ncbi:Nucleotide-binding universal stress protein, UspA family [Marinococcus luteus]|uniref:Nucleotide-binding universal stress protein, UspA family n=1 Tax=Marinococcus luteus TaxID=1122204 RepID=A0A1H2QIG3_9BACI|nr:universal stress protein [Marinococcus luteus]SDW06668.1 Nucleotide-binding universal stress protein, UspA family [Marinococcus luteus]